MRNKTKKIIVVLVILTWSFTSYGQWSWGTTISSPTYWQPNSTISYSNLSNKFNLHTTDSNAANFLIQSGNWDLGGGFGMIEGANVVSPVVWMYNYGGNAFTIASKTFSSGQGPDVICDYLNPLFQVREDGNVGIGTTSPDARLTVNGTIHSKEVKIDLSIPVPDYVFEKDYNLPALDSIKTYITQNKHLPEVPSAKEMETNGVNVGEMDMLLLKKVEELTLYMIEQKDEIEALRYELNIIKDKN